MIFELLNEVLPGISISVIIIGIATWLSTLVNQRLSQKWQQAKALELEGVKNNLTQQSKFISDLTNHYSQTHRKLLDKKIEASEIIWQSILNMKQTFPTPVLVIYQILTESEITYDNLKSSNFREALESDSFVNIFVKNAKDLREASLPINKNRLFLSEELWLLSRAYEGFIGRTVYLLINGYNHRKIQHWKKDTGVRQILATVLSEEEIDFSYKMNLKSYEALLSYMESKVLSEIGRLLSDDKLVNDTMNLAQKINEIEKAKPNIKSSLNQ